jgi:hypothetical protein
MKLLDNINVDHGPFVSLFNNPDDFEHVFSSLEHTILSSFALDAQLTGSAPKITTEEIRRRFSICEHWFRVMRGELGWGLRRTLDAIPKALANTLLGFEYDPSSEGEHGWGPEASSIPGVVERLKGK